MEVEKKNLPWLHKMYLRMRVTGLFSRNLTNKVLSMFLEKK